MGRRVPALAEAVPERSLEVDEDALGQALVVLTAGTGVFKVAPKLTQLTKQRMMDIGVGVDVVSVTRAPLHATPLFVYKYAGAGLASALWYVRARAQARGATSYT